MWRARSRADFFTHATRTRGLKNKKEKRGGSVAAGHPVVFVFRVGEASTMPLVYFRFRQAYASRPKRPEAKRAMVPGSGTGLTPPKPAKMAEPTG